MSDGKRMVLMVVAATLMVCLAVGCTQMTPQSEPVATPLVAPDDGRAHVSMAVPTGEKESSTLWIDKSAPREIRVGQEFTYEIAITNLASCKLEDVIVTDRLQPNFEYKRAMPKEQSIARNEVSWVIGNMEPKGTTTIRVTGVAEATGPLTQCSKVAYRTPLCMTVVAVEPKLILTKSAPEEVMLCDPIPVRLVVANAGSGKAENVMVKDNLPPGIRTLDGKNVLQFNAGTLMAGESKEFSAQLKADRTGRYVNKATAEGDGGLASEASTATVVREPVLVITKTAPQKLFLGREIGYEITVTNKGDAAAMDTVLQDPIPTGTKFVKASAGGRTMEGIVSWHLGRLEVNESKTAHVTLFADTIQTIHNTATATAVCAKAVAATALTELVGIPAILLEVVDLADPLEVGKEETYVIVATNQGTADATNVTMVCTLEDTLQYIGSEGPTVGRLMGNMVNFAPLAKLAPKAQATWHVMAKGVEAGDTRFKVSMTSDQLTRPVEETEATNVYR